MCYFFCGASVTDSIYLEVVTLVISGNSFSADLKWIRYDSFIPDDEIDEGEGHLEGVVETNSDLIVLNPRNSLHNANHDNPFLLRPVANGIFLYEQQDVRWAPGYFPWRVYERQ